MHVDINLILLQRKSCSVHMTVFEIVVQQLDIMIVMMYLGADNSLELHDLLRCNLKIVVL